jgi:phage gp46-like protein
MAYTDVLFSKPDGYYDLSIGSDGDFEKLDSFDTALQLSLFGSDRRASATEEATPQKRRGWVGNQFADVELGSKLWLLYQARLTNETVNRAKTYCQQALQWLIDYGYAKSLYVETSRDITRNTLTARIQITAFDGITETRYFLLWGNTGS